MKSRCYSSFPPLRELQDNNLIPAVFYTYKFILPTYTYLYYHDIILRFNYYYYYYCITFTYIDC